MIGAIDQGREALHSLFIYLGTIFHFLFQQAALEATEVAINIIVGVLVAGFTLTKIIDWFERRKEE